MNIYYNYTNNVTMIVIIIKNKLCTCVCMYMSLYMQRCIILYVLSFIRSKFFFNSFNCLCLKSFVFLFIWSLLGLANIIYIWRAFRFSGYSTKRERTHQAISFVSYIGHICHRTLRYPYMHRDNMQLTSKWKKRGGGGTEKEKTLI